MYDSDFVYQVLDRIKNGESPEKLIKELKVSRGTIYSWLKGKIPHKKLFQTEEEYKKNYYQTHKEQFKRNGYLSRIGFDGTKILERDNYTCKSCGRTKKLEVHHIDGNNKNNDLNNMITLCMACHRNLNWVLQHPYLTYLVLKTSDGKAENKRLPTNCPLCERKYRYYIAFATHMLRKHQWEIEKSLEYFSIHTPP